MAPIWRPAAYQGHNVRGTYFEGWYYKMVGPGGQHRLAVIPGVYRHGSDDSLTHAFIQTLDGSTGESAYHRFPLEAFSAAQRELDVHIGENHFRADCIRLALDDLHGELTFGERHEWPVRPLSPGVMGPFRFVPGMQCYHGVLGFDHPISGALTWRGQPVDFTGGRGYMEKDWGRGFPRAYVWMQTNHFTSPEGSPQPNTSLTGSIATIPFAGSWFRGMIFGLWRAGTLYRFTTYLRSQVDRLAVSRDHVEITLRGGSTSADPRGDFAAYRLELIADRSEGGSLAAPEPVGMIERVVESMTATIHTHLIGISRDKRETTLFQGTGHHAGLEVSGTIEEILSSE